MTEDGEDEDAASAFDLVLDSRHRLLICALLLRRGDLEFGELTEATGLLKSSLSKHLTVLRRSDYVTIERLSAPGRARTRIALTTAGRAMLSAHAAALREILGDLL